jgi:hypothetical protein
MRESPFLHRTWKKAVERLGLTSISSASGITTLASANGDKPVGGDHIPRATKRRRVVEETPEPNTDAAFGHLFHESPADVEKALRIEVLRIGREDGHDSMLNGLLNGTGSPAKREALLTKARCRVTIFRWRQKPVVEIRPLYCDSQTCNIKVLRDADNICRSARVYLPQPFHIAAEKIFVERDDDYGFTFADFYLIQAELLSAGDPSWPPLALLNGLENRKPSPSPPRQWALSASFMYKFVKGRMTSPVSLRKNPGEETQTDLKMDMDLRWSCFNAAGSTSRPLQEETPPSTTTPSLNGALEPLTNGHINGRADNLVHGQLRDDLDVDDEYAEGDAQTPSRSLRTRGKPQNYNLKLLSDKARGKEDGERKKRKHPENSSTGQVTYLLPTSGELHLSHWSCIRCFAEHSSFNHLEEHLVRNHPEFKYTFDVHSRVGWTIAITKHGEVFKHRHDDTEDESEDEVSSGKPEVPKTPELVPVSPSCPNHTAESEN